MFFKKIKEEGSNQKHAVLYKPPKKIKSALK